MKWDSFQHIFIFGDSYSSTSMFWGFDRPTTDNPFGVEWPGEPFCEPDHPNYIGYLHEMLKSQYPLNPIPFIYNYSHGGDTIETQLHVARGLFVHGAGKKPEWARWTSENSLFIIEIGINDCGGLRGQPIEDTARKVFDLMDAAYEVGARHFIITDVPPVQRFPGVFRSTKELRGLIEARIGTWNRTLKEGVELYTESHSEQVHIKLFSMQDLFTRLLDDPSAFGFKNKSSEFETVSQFFCDHIHPTTAVHEIMAKELFGLLAAA